MKKPAPNARPLTHRQVEVLAGIAFGEVWYEEMVFGATVRVKVLLNSFPKEFESVRAVDVSSVVVKLRKYKLVRTKRDADHSRHRQLGVYAYLALTPLGYAELAKHPEQWNV